MNEQIGTTKPEAVKEPRMHFKPHRSDEGFDEVEIKIVPRFKESETSGDEWRIEALIALKRKGAVIFLAGARNLESAVKYLPWLLETVCEKSDSEDGWTEHHKKRSPECGIYGLGKNECAQPGCTRDPIVFYALEKEFSDNGFFEREIDRNGAFDMLVRGFCKIHKDRGDGGREDNMKNYREIPRPA